MTREKKDRSFYSLMVLPLLVFFMGFFFPVRSTPISYKASSAAKRREANQGR
jgi:hypothetical protein